MVCLGSKEETSHDDQDRHQAVHRPRLEARLRRLRPAGRRRGRRGHPDQRPRRRPCALSRGVDQLRPGAIPVFFLTHTRVGVWWL